MVGLSGLVTWKTGVWQSEVHADAPASVSTPSQSSDVNPYSAKSFTPTGKLPSTVILYQYEVCPFCCKVKAFLDYHNIPYRVVEVNPLSKAEIKWSEYKKVPVVVLDGSTQLNNSSTIVSTIAAEIEAKEVTKSRSLWSSKGSPTSQPSEEDMISWRRWVDERFVRAITVNIYRNAKEAFQTFDYITEQGNFGWAQRQAARVVGATMMWGISSRLKKKYEIEGDVREALYALSNEWADHVGDQAFMGGAHPCLADIEVFGVLRSIVGTDTFMDVQHNTRIGPWYERMMKEVGTSSRIVEG